MTGFNDAADTAGKIDTKHLPSTCRDAASAGCTKHHAPISNAFQENGAF
ncbi:large pilS cassette protein [Neisseria gonorrhoeae]